MTRLDFMAQDLMKQPVTKQDLIEHGVIGQKALHESTVDIYIRDAWPSDRKAIRELTLAAYQEYAKPLGGYWEGYKKGLLKALEHVKPAEQIVIDDNGEIVATILLYPASTTFTAPNGAEVTAPFPELRLLAVSPDKRGRGLGTLLVREAIERSREQKAKAVMLHMVDVMPNFSRMYERMGFVHFPEFDFWLAPQIGLECYCLNLEGIET
jgi:predicted N-acetyltransferase YhbS